MAGAKYFGHRPAWAQPKARPFAMPQGGPVARPNPNPYNKGTPAKTGQIIPPLSAGQHPRGRSLPGYFRGAPMSPAMARRMARLMMGGVLKALSPLEWAMMLGDLMYGDSWALQPGGWNVPAGWTKCPTPDCDGAPTHGIWSAGGTCAALPPCPPGQAGGSWPTTRLHWGTVHATRLNVTAYIQTSGNETDATFRGTIVAQFVRPSAAVVTMPEFTANRTMRLPGVMPFPFPSPAPQSETKEKSEPRNRAAPFPRANTTPAMAYTPSKPGGVPVDHANVPPPPGTHEKKGLVLHAGRVGRAYGALTEFGDMLDCVAKSIPGNPCKGLRMHEKAACVAKHGRKIDVAKAATCIMMDAAQDAAIGKFNKAVRDAAVGNPYWKRPVGPGAGGWAARYYGSPKMPRM